MPLNMKLSACMGECMCAFACAFECVSRAWWERKWGKNERVYIIKTWKLCSGAAGKNVDRPMYLQMAANFRNWLNLRMRIFYKIIWTHLAFLNKKMASKYTRFAINSIVIIAKVVLTNIYCKKYQVCSEVKSCLAKLKHHA